MASRQSVTRPNRAPRRMAVMLVLVALVFGGVFGLKWFMASQTNAFFDNMPQPPVAVTAFEARAERWSDREEAVGTFTAVNGTDVTTEAGGVVRAIEFEAGQPVRAGAVLVRLNTENELAALRALEAAAALAATQRDRWQELGRQKLVSQAEVDQRTADAASTRAQAEAQRALIAQKVIRAPFDGLLGIRRVNLGQYVNPGDPIVSLQSLDPIHLDFTLPEQRIGAVLPGTRVHATVDALPGRTFEGEVTAVEPGADPGTRNFRVQATFDNAGHDLRPGTFARVGFDVGGEREVVVIPQTAVSFNPYGNAVYVIEEAPAADGAAAAPAAGDGDAAGPRLAVRQRFVTTGQARGDLVAVSDGLAPGERVVTSGLLRLRNGAEVTINDKVQPTAEADPAPGNR